MDPTTLPLLEAAVNERINVPWDGLELAIRAVRTGNRNAFRGGNPEQSRWVLQDEKWDHESRSVKILGSSAYGTTRP